MYIYIYIYCIILEYHVIVIAIIYNTIPLHPAKCPPLESDVARPMSERGLWKVLEAGYWPGVLWWLPIAGLGFFCVI